LNGYLLDTNHCSRLIDGHAAVVGRLSELGGARVVTCAIVQGELIFMGYMSLRQHANLNRVRSFLNSIEVLPLERNAADRYGELKAAILHHVAPRQTARQKKVRVGELGFQDNDLWIAAVALSHKLILVSADSDFQRLREVRDLPVEQWWTPAMDAPSGNRP
jgi:tRNA(fMet)-specific endonuclease VapC